MIKPCFSEAVVGGPPTGQGQPLWPHWWNWALHLGETLDPSLHLGADVLSSRELLEYVRTSNRSLSPTELGLQWNNCQTLEPRGPLQPEHNHLTLVVLQELGHPFDMKTFWDPLLRRAVLLISTDRRRNTIATGCHEFRGTLACILSY